VYVLTVGVRTLLVVQEKIAVFGHPVTDRELLTINFFFIETQD
jgi:hypothetical protein